MAIVYSRQVENEFFKIKIGSLEGKRPAPNLSQLIENPHLIYSGLEDNACADLLIQCTLESDCKPLCPPIQTSYKYFTNTWNWNEWIEFPIDVCDLPRDTVIVFTILDSISPSKTVILGKAFVSIFGHQGIMRTGLYDLRVWLEEELKEHGDSVVTASLSGQDELDRLYELKSNYLNGQTIKVDWLDKLTFLEIEKVTQKMKSNSNNMFLSVEYPKALIDNTIDVPIVYLETTLENQNNFVPIKNDLNTINDPELGLENLIEAKHHKLSRSTRSCISDKDLKPNSSDRDQLNAIVSSPPTKILTSEEQDLVWKFRFYLMSQKKALTKFLKCLNWQSPTEVKTGLELMEAWQPMDTQDALELLAPQFQHPKVRLYAVSRLRQATDEDLLLYLLQLVQALKYEQHDKNGLDNLPASWTDIDISNCNKSPNECEQQQEPQKPLKQAQQTLQINHIQQQQQHPQTEEQTEWDLSTFLINRCVQDDVLANYFYWYLVVEIENFSQNLGHLSSNSTSSLQAHRIYTQIMNRFIGTLSCDRLRKRCDFLTRQRMFVDKLVTLMVTVAKENKNRLGKIDRLKELLGDQETLNFDFTHMDPPLSLPLDPSIKIKGILPHQATLFKSQLMPCKLTLLTTIPKRNLESQREANSPITMRLPGSKGTESVLSTSPLTMAKHLNGLSINDTDQGPPYLEYDVIFKHGDDLRQDQLILQTITLMDKLLRRENLDLKLTPYRVLATSTRHGFVQFIESMSLAEIRANEGSIQNFFRRYAPCPDSPHGILPEVMDAYVRSCAGYCVITYVLGVGDRHLDNLLLTKSGRLFHIDFGYILGRDPKPMPPPMKLTREMVEAMGGTTSEFYREFLNLSHTAFLHLRRHSNLILNLFSLMVDANVPDIALEPDKTVKKVQDKFRLDLSDEEAVHYIQNLIEISVSDVMAVLVEQIHKIAQYWRK